jgi:hypothetical protein
MALAGPETEIQRASLLYNARLERTQAEQLRQTAADLLAASEYAKALVEIAGKLT